MPDHARLWIYQADRKLNSDELQMVQEQVAQFVNQWQAHGHDLKASYEINHDQFLTLVVDETYSQPSGCSIDASVHLIQQLESELNISFMTSGQIAFMESGQVNLVPFNQLKAQVQEKKIHPETQIFDNTIQHLGDFRKEWLKPSKDTWVNRYFQ